MESKAETAPTAVRRPAARRSDRTRARFTPGSILGAPRAGRFTISPGRPSPNAPGFSVESSYYTWVDQHDTLGLGKDVLIATGNLFDGVHALVNSEFVTLRLPYPLGFYSRSADSGSNLPARRAGR